MDELYDILSRHVLAYVGDSRYLPLITFLCSASSLPSTYPTINLPYVLFPRHSHGDTNRQRRIIIKSGMIRLMKTQNSGV